MDHENGLAFFTTDSIKRFLEEAASSSALPTETAMRLRDSETVPYVVLRDAWKKMPSEGRPEFRHLLEGATFALKPPKPREKSTELQERLRKLQQLNEERTYNELVKDVVRKRDDTPFSTYKDQLGFGVHVIVVMFTGFAFGYFVFRSLFQNDPVMHVAGGLVGLFLGMMLETTLFIVRDCQYQNSLKRQAVSSKKRR